MTREQALPGRENQESEQCEFQTGKPAFSGGALVLRAWEDGREMVITGTEAEVAEACSVQCWRGGTRIHGEVLALLNTPMRSATFFSLQRCVMVITPLQAAGTEQISMALFYGKHEHAMPLRRKVQIPGRGKWPELCFNLCCRILKTILAASDIGTSCFKNAGAFHLGWEWSPLLKV